MPDIDTYEVKKRRLLESLIKNQYLKDKRLIDAFLETPLEEFIPKEHLKPSLLYEDNPNLFYYLNNQNYRTISAPHMISIMLQGLALEEKDDLLILGAKSGYIAALAHKLAPEGKILILEANSDIAKITSDNLQRLNFENIEVIVKNPLEGIKEKGPWKKILVTGAIKQERIYKLLRQLDSNEGVLYAPIGEDQVQIYTQILRVKDEFFGKKQLHVRFTPLMTKVELDSLELITDFEEFEIIDDPQKVDETLSRVEIKYATNLLDNIDLDFIKEPPTPREIASFEALIRKRQAEIIKKLKRIRDIIKKLKKEDKIDQCFSYVEEIEDILDGIKGIEKFAGAEEKDTEELLNQIRSHNIMRKKLDKETTAVAIDKKIEIINKQMDLISQLERIIKEEIKALKEI